MGGERGRVGNETGERKEGEEQGRDTPGSCLHPSDLKSWIKTLGMARILRGESFSRKET